VDQAEAAVGTPPPRAEAAADLAADKVEGPAVVAVAAEAVFQAAPASSEVILRAGGGELRAVQFGGSQGPGRCCAFDERRLRSPHRSFAVETINSTRHRVRIRWRVLLASPRTMSFWQKGVCVAVGRGPHGTGLV
jgi:hypothetical protein